ncbi:MAG: Lrp/AsnC family transcriptional regulator [Pseudomonadota bacterium]
MRRLGEPDRTILSLLQKDSRVKMETLAAEAGTSVATVQRRIREMRKTGVIASEVVLLNPAAVGYGMTFLILVELERESVHQLDEFRRKMKAEPQIQQCYYITGEADFAAIALARDMDDFQQLTQRLFFDDPNIKRFRTSVVMDRTKATLAVPLD